ncbi:3-methyladenine DNA glycosylase 2 [Pseudomonas sp. FW215-R2]|uniref:DNA-3-methyladenine glycosylase family protein n=1 Tax=unclassified Pseudomonas TaxID=196821 RepID=UPI000C884A6A|nr:MULTISPECIES: AlkA N-terminal domain-containing protein [unclassified Pseudomonas]PMW97282.1 3-methyladenine DNA glycosylase 2 [Pseudomonas sp. FW215-R2]PMX08362.1 3-methyladenine DNA glycosylase 2 [Pseudomonas sp. FW215-L1]PMX20482.1 3-methyladenine DNA glycosylase 2 [Pseudomonas sp. FW215-E1]PNA27868.1 3-methyladenine DNA glycosylase 2 [Pseudomonas sp. FW215-R4]
MRLRLEYQAPYDWPAMLGFLAARAVVGMETVVDGMYSRSIGLNGVHGTVSVWPGDGDALEVELDFPDATAVPEIITRLRRLFDLDADLPTMQRHLAADPLLAPLIAERPGLRVPGAWDGLELAFRAVLGQQITVVGAIRLAGKMVAQYGEPLRSSVSGLTHVFPQTAVLAVADLAALGMPKSRGRTLSGVAQALLDDPLLFASGTARLLALHGIGDWTAQYIALRQLRDMDGFPTGDVGLLRALEVLEGERMTARELSVRAEAWRPFRGYAAQVLWASLSRFD